MVTGRHDIDTDIKQFRNDIRGQTETGSSILDIGNHQVNHMLVDQARERVTHQLATGTADNIADKEDIQNNSKLL
jgi:hypothetical protein